MDSKKLIRKPYLDALEAGIVRASQVFAERESDQLQSVSGIYILKPPAATFPALDAIETKIEAPGWQIVYTTKLEPSYFHSGSWRAPAVSSVAGLLDSQLADIDVWLPGEGEDGYGDKAVREYAYAHALGEAKNLRGLFGFCTFWARAATFMHFLVAWAAVGAVTMVQICPEVLAKTISPGFFPAILVTMAGCGLLGFRMWVQSQCEKRMLRTAGARRKNADQCRHFVSDHRHVTARAHDRLVKHAADLKEDSQGRERRQDWPVLKERCLALAMWRRDCAEGNARARHVCGQWERVSGEGLSIHARFKARYFNRYLPRGLVRVVQWLVTAGSLGGAMAAVVVTQPVASPQTLASVGLPLALLVAVVAWQVSVLDGLVDHAVTGSQAPEEALDGEPDPSGGGPSDLAKMDIHLLDQLRRDAQRLLSEEQKRW